jgi:hypothetical protein
MIKMKISQLGVGLALFASAMVASANTITVSTSKNPIKANSDNQGFFADFYTTGVKDNRIDNYGTGNGGYYTVRSFFSFDLSDLDGVIESAVFKVRRYTQTADGRLDLRSLSTPASALVFNRSTDAPGYYDALGSGNIYASNDVKIGASDDVLSFVLNATAIADLNARVGAGYFSLAANFESLGYIFGAGYNEPGFDGGNSVQALELKLKDPTTNVPLPGGFALLGLGLLAFGVNRKRQA